MLEMGINMNQNYRRIDKPQSNILDRMENKNDEVWSVDAVGIPKGDMPGDGIKIHKHQVEMAKRLLPEIMRQLKPVIIKNPYQRAVIAICGGSGVGKTGIASVLSNYFNVCGVGSYTMSGDNYPRRIPKYNDAERLHIFRESGLRGLIDDGVCTGERFKKLQEWQRQNEDANPIHAEKYPWFSSYLRAGRKGLKGYLGTPNEIAFEDVSDIVAAFLDGAGEIWLKRMGREETEVWYDCVDFCSTHILVLEWTHGNSGYVHGVDIPVLLNSTPEETKEYRKLRNRDCGTDSAFTSLVLEIEQNLIKQQASKAKIIFSKNGDLLDYPAYCKIMRESGES